jgi:glycosyltransferase 2 family protein
MIESEGSLSMTTDLELAAPVAPKARVKRYLWALVLSGLAIYFLLPHFAAMGRAVLVISNLRIPFVILSFGSQALSYAGSGYLLRSVVRPTAKPVSIVDGALITAGGNSVGTLGGGVLGTAGMTYLWLRRRGVNVGVAGLGAWLPIFLNNIALAVAALGGLIVIVYLKKSSGAIVVSFALVCLILVGVLAVFALFLLYRKNLVPIVTALARFAAKFRRKPFDRAKVEVAVGYLLEGWDELWRVGWHGPMVGTFLNIGFDMLTLGLLFRAAGCRLSAAALLAGYGIPQILGKFTVILGGVGVIETSMVGLFTLLGTPRPSAVVAVLAYRLLSFWIPTIAGVAMVPYLERRFGTSIEPTPATESNG